MDNEPVPAQGETINFGLSFKDWTRIVWTFVQAALGFAILQWTGAFGAGGEVNWRALLVGAAAAGVSAVKNFVLSDQSNIK